METLFLPYNNHTALLSMYVMAPLVVMYFLSTVADLFASGKQLAVACINDKNPNSDLNAQNLARLRHSRINRTTAKAVKVVPSDTSRCKTPCRVEGLNLPTAEPERETAVIKQPDNSEIVQSKNYTLIW